MVMKPEPSNLVEEILIKRIELKNGQILELYDASRKVAGDRWLVSLIARISIPTDSSLLNNVDLQVGDMEEIRNALGEKIVYEKKRARNFIDEGEKNEILEELMHSFINTSIAYLSNKKFPRNFILKMYQQKTHNFQ